MCLSPKGSSKISLSLNQLLWPWGRGTQCLDCPGMRHILSLEIWQRGESGREGVSQWETRYKCQDTSRFSLNYNNRRTLQTGRQRNKFTASEENGALHRGSVVGID